jgi:putative solute:sodium symporter small subunit
MAATTLSPERRTAYWRRTKTLMILMLVVWALAGLVIPAFASPLNNITVLGFPLGFYMSSQGSLIIFVILCFWNASAQNKIDEQFGVSED